MSLAVDNPILNNPFEEPKEYWIYEEGLEVKGYESEQIEKIIAEVRGEGKFQMKLSLIDEIAIVEGKG